MRTANHRKDFLGVRCPTEQLTECVGVLVVSRGEYLELPLNATACTSGLVLQDPQAKAIVLRHNANEDSACSRAGVAHALSRVGSEAQVNLFNSRPVYRLPVHSLIEQRESASQGTKHLGPGERPPTLNDHLRLLAYRSACR